MLDFLSFNLGFPDAMSMLLEIHQNYLEHGQLVLVTSSGHSSLVGFLGVDFVFLGGDFDFVGTPIKLIRHFGFVVAHASIMLDFLGLMLGFLEATCVLLEIQQHYVEQFGLTLVTSLGLPRFRLDLLGLILGFLELIFILLEF